MKNQIKENICTKTKQTMKLDSQDWKGGGMALYRTGIQGIIALNFLIFHISVQEYRLRQFHKK